jgi:uncharacterized protein YndB with AHSA1/START domain
MGFPDRIERTVHVQQPQERVWTAITTAEGLGTWFGNSAEIDLRIERLEPTSVFGYTWGFHGAAEDDPRRTYVEFTLTPDGSGTTLTVIESGFAQLGTDEHAKAFESNTGGWKHELDELVAYLHG